MKRLMLIFAIATGTLTLCAMLTGPDNVIRQCREHAAIIYPVKWLGIIAFILFFRRVMQWLLTLSEGRLPEAELLDRIERWRWPGAAGVVILEIVFYIRVF